MLFQILGILILFNSGCSVAFNNPKSLETHIVIEVLVGVLLVLIGTLKGLIGDKEPDVTIRDGKWCIDESNSSKAKLAMKLGHPLRDIDLDIANSSMNFYEFLEHGGKNPPLKDIAAKYQKYKESLEL